MSKKILIISDYIDKNLGGIETYIYEVKDILEKQGFVIKILGYKTNSSKLKKLLLLFLSFFNIHGFWKLKKELKKFKPDIIRLHSITRARGPIGILPVKSFNKKSMIMYHDLGYFYPFANRIYDENQLVLPFTFKNWIKALKTHSLSKKIYGIFKYFKLLLLRKTLIDYIDVHLVPSDFMVDILKKWGVSENKIKVLRHFIK